MFPKIEVDLEQFNTTLLESNKIIPIGKTFSFDYKSGQHVLVDGKMIECSFDEAIAQWIEKVLRTELDKYGIYTEDESKEFGISIYRYIGTKSLHMGYIASELKREIIEQLLEHRYIKSIEEYRVERQKRNLNIYFTAVLEDGTHLEKVVKIDGF